MSNDRQEILDDPTNRIVCTFEDRQAAENAKNALAEVGIAPERIRVLDEAGSADVVDTSAKWFADTDKEMKKFAQELRAGNTVVTIPIGNSNDREEVHSILQDFAARHVTHFGEWITKVMR